jgi:hypothetical protein
MRTRMVFDHLNVRLAQCPGIRHIGGDSDAGMTMEIR